ncbi:MAG: helix-turn-helix domain-containing protein [Acidimicrobiia bacterium]
METHDRLLTVEELAEYFGVPVATVYAWRYRREGPPGFRVGKYVRYRMRDVQEWTQRQLEHVDR